MKVFPRKRKIIKKEEYKIEKFQNRSDFLKESIRPPFVVDHETVLGVAAEDINPGDLLTIDYRKGSIRKIRSSEEVFSSERLSVPLDKDRSIIVSYDIVEEILKTICREIEVGDVQDFYYDQTRKYFVVQMKQPLKSWFVRKKSFDDLPPLEKHIETLKIKKKVNEFIKDGKLSVMSEKDREKE